MPNRIIGILGGMGPKSTADFFLRVVNATGAKTDQEHRRIIIDCNPQIPDRTAAILGNGESPAEQLKITVHNLEKAGAEIIAMPCNTAHYYFADLQKSTRVPIINMLEETAAYIFNNFPEVERIGLLATTGTLEAQIYQHALDDLELIVPDAHNQRRVMTAIYGPQGIKAGFTRGLPREFILEEATRLVERRAQLIIAGCTEISLVLTQEDLPIPLVDPLEVLVESTLRESTT